MIDTELPLIKFTALDRCDRCGAQAYSMATRDDAASELLFCAHHSNEYEDKLLSDDWYLVYDYEGIEGLAQEDAKV
jgi:hypothetical protein